MDFYNLADLKTLIKNGDVSKIKDYMKKYNLKLDGNKIVPADKDEYLKQYAFYDQRNLIKKILLNSLYGALLNPHSRFFDQRMGQSVTLTGRCITKHMLSKTNELINGLYKHDEDATIYGDSVSYDSIIDTNFGFMTIERLFHTCSVKWTNGDREYSGDNNIKIKSFDLTSNNELYSNIDYIFRHKTTKQKWKIEDENGNYVIVTDDHSVAILRGASIIDSKPSEIQSADFIIISNKQPSRAKIQKIGHFDNEYVYDISVKHDNPYFFANNILVHNTDSCYFSAYNQFKDTDFEWSVDNVVELYDTIANQINESFPEFMMNAFHVDKEHGEIIQAGREVVAKKGLFIKKKRYALLCNDVEGDRKDKDGKPGKLKAMGVELKRSDTPATIQKFLEDVLMMALTGSSEDDVRKFVKDFRMKFREWKGWEKGAPKRVNGLTNKVEKEETFGKVAMAGHQRASMNWNKMKEMFRDNYSMAIQDGSKVVVCKLLSNPSGFTSVAYPVDQEKLPEWFTSLPFDHEGMEEMLIDKKLENILGVLNWILKRPEDNNTFDDLFG